MQAENEEAVSFYDALAPMFDVMTDWDARLMSEGPFLRRHLESIGARRVIDVACGSGGHAIALGRWGFEVVGADASPVMIEMARDKAHTLGLSVQFHVADLAGVATLGGAPFDAVLCLGNSLPHVLDRVGLDAAFAAMASLLRPDGVIILQNLNYDLRWRTRPRFFGAQGGELSGQQVLVWRFADYDDAVQRISFHIALFHHESNGWEVKVHTTPQRPWQHAELVSALERAGFDRIEALGRMALPEEPFTEDVSADLVLVAYK